MASRSFSVLHAGNGPSRRNGGGAESDDDGSDAGVVVRAKPKPANPPCTKF